VPLMVFRSYSLRLSFHHTNAFICALRFLIRLLLLMMILFEFVENQRRRLEPLHNRTIESRQTFHVNYLLFASRKCR